MKTVAICNSCIKNINPDVIIHDFLLNGTSIPVGILDAPEPDYDKYFTPQSILVKVRAFSCNYRDKTLMHLFNECCKELSIQQKYFYSPFGSEFVAEVIKTGRDVKSLKLGDRVIPDGTYPFKPSGAMGGLPTNFASQRIQVFKEEQVIKIPDSMPDEIAACFTIGAQTSYSMMNRLQLKPNENLLITSGSSNTSLFMINAAKNSDANVYVTSTNNSHKNSFMDMGIKNFIPYSQFTDKSLNIKFDAVVDPFFDISLMNVLPFMNHHSRYITCGVYYQHPLFDKINSEINFNQIMNICLINNITLIGNCVGSKDDLEKALADFANSKLDVIIDSIFTGMDIIPFLEKTFSIAPRFGKVVYKYND
jgi:NADPH:quinone reductase-like Zn-dependent oxidoreductase